MAESNPLWREYPKRVRQARRLMEEQQVDALLLFTGPNLAYFTGMPCGRSGSRPFIYLLPRRAEPVLIVQEGRQFEARAFTSLDDIRTYKELSKLPLDAVLKVLEDRGLERGRLGVELGGELVLDLPYQEFASLQEALPGADFLDASSLLWRLRMIKSGAEIACLAMACAITLEAYELTFQAIRPGMTEADIERTMLREMLALGGGSPWVLITSGPGNYDLVSKGGGPRQVEPGDMVWMDCGCAVAGYFSDFGRAGVLGGPSRAQVEAQREIHRITRMGLEMARPGTPVSEIAARCNEAVRAAGLPITSNISELAARVGHGLGMVPTELPSLSETDPTRLAAGMVVTMEPGVATKYGTFHVEENVLVTEQGPRVLSEGHWELWTI